PKAVTGRTLTGTLLERADAMRSTILSVTVLAGVLFAGTALAQVTNPTPTMPAQTTYYSSPTQVNGPAGDDTIVCNYQRETGSLMISRVCRTLRAWKRMQADAKEYMG